MFISSPFILCASAQPFLSSLFWTLLECVILAAKHTKSETPYIEIVVEVQVKSSSRFIGDNSTTHMEFLQKGTRIKHKPENIIYLIHLSIMFIARINWYG
jgi:hypothetical protein